MKIGLWIDKKEAYVIRIDGNYIVTTTIKSDIGFFNEKDILEIKQEEISSLEVENAQVKRYFKKLVSEISNVERLVIFGSDEMFLKFYKNLKFNNKEIYNKVVGFEKTLCVTNNQKKAYVRAFFEKNKVFE